MKKKSLSLIFLAMLFAFSPAFAQVTGQVEYKALGLKFTIPPTWVGQETEEGMLLGSNTEAGLLVVLPHEYTSFEQIKQGAEEGLIDEGIELRRSGEFKQEGARAIGAEFSGKVQGESAKAYVIAVLNPKGGGITVMALTTTAIYSEQLVSRGRSLAGSVVFFEPEVSSAIQEWKTFLSDVRLSYIKSSYSSGPSYGGYSTYSGHSDQTVISLCAAGYYKLSSKSSVSIDSGGAFGSSHGGNQGAGSWDVVGDAQGNPILQLKAHDGSLSQYSLEYKDGKTYLNGSRYFRTLPGDSNGFVPDCP